MGRNHVFLVLLLCMLTLGLGVTGVGHGQAPDGIGQTVLVEQITFTGHTAFDDQTLNEVVNDGMGRALSLEELEALASLVTQHYRSSGYFLAQVIIPEQDILDGIITFQVLEGRLGKIVVAGNENFDEKHVRQAFKSVIPGSPINKGEVERALLVLNQLPGIKVRSILRAGEQVGTTDILVEVTEDKSLAGRLDINNFGTSSSGEYRISPSLRVPNLTGRGDSLGFNVGASLSADVGFSHMNYTSPLGFTGLQLHTYAALGSSRIDQGLADLEIKGNNFGWGLGTSYPHLLDTRESLTSRVWVESKDSTQTMLGVTTSEDRIRKLRLGMEYDKSMAGGRTAFSADLHVGLGENFGAMANDSLLSSRAFARADNEFIKATADFSWIQLMSQRLSFITQLAGQYSFQPVVVGEQWSIGGANSVRGHSESRYGDDGFTANLEARYSILPKSNNHYQLVVFADYGSIHVKRPTIGTEQSQQLAGIGIGTRIDLNERINLRLDWGFPLGKEEEEGSVVYVQSIFRF